MKKIFLGILALCLLSALVGCGGSGSSSSSDNTEYKSMYLGVWELGVSMPLYVDNENTEDYIWNEKTVHIDGIGDFMEIVNVNNPADCFIYLNSSEKGVFYGYRENETQEYDIIKYFDYNNSVWKSGENIICSVVEKDEETGICKIKATDGKDTIYYDFYALLGLPGFAETKSYEEFENMNFDRFKLVISRLAKIQVYKYELLHKIYLNFRDKKKEIENRNPLTEEDKRKIKDLDDRMQILRKALTDHPIE